jgi:hypothetical protein
VSQARRSHPAEKLAVEAIAALDAVSAKLYVMTSRAKGDELRRQLEALERSCRIVARRAQWVLR